MTSKEPDAGCIAMGKEAESVVLDLVKPLAGPAGGAAAGMGRQGSMPLRRDTTTLSFPRTEVCGRNLRDVVV